MPYLSAADGARLFYLDEGQGLPLLCLSGLTRNVNDFNHLAEQALPFRMIRMDYRGRGLSDYTGAATYTVPQEAEDALRLMDHLGLDRAAILGTSRGGLIAMGLAATSKDRLLGVCLNDVGPEIHRPGLERIFGYVGRNPRARTHGELAAALPRNMPGFANVAPERWLSESSHHYRQTPEGLKIRYDPALRDSFLAAFDGPPVDLWPFFDAMAGLPLATIRGANSDLLSAKTLAEMRRRRPDMIVAEVPDRAHVPFLDEPESLDAIRAFLDAVAG